MKNSMIDYWSSLLLYSLPLASTLAACTCFLLAKLLFREYILRLVDSYPLFAAIDKVNTSFEYINVLLSKAKIIEFVYSLVLYGFKYDYILPYPILLNWFRYFDYYILGGLFT